MICNTFRFWRRGITPFLQPFTYTEINLNIIYMATDYSMYKAGTKQKKQKNKTTGSKLKLTGAKKLHTVHVNSPEEAWGDLAETQIFSGAWKLSSNKDWPPTEYSR